MDNSTETLLQQLFINHGWTLSLAESCTGGAIAAHLTRHPQCSKYFLGSIVAYSNLLKIKVLDVEEKMIREEGAVSEAVVKQMARGVLQLSGSDYSLAISGIAGPGGGTPSKPVGTVWGAIGQKNGEIRAFSNHFVGNREEIIEESVNWILSHLLSLIKNKIKDMGKTAY